MESIRTKVKDVLSGTNLAIPDPYRKFYIKTDWYKCGMRESILKSDILQSYDSEEAIKSEAQEKDDIKCEFYKSMEGMRPRPISSISRSTVLPLEKSKHSFVGESDAVQWAIV